MFDKIFAGAIQAGKLAEQTATYLEKYIPGDWDIRKNADPELFDALYAEPNTEIPDDPDRFKGHPVKQDPKIVTEASPIALDITRFLETTFQNLQTLAQGKQTNNQDPTTVINPASNTVNEAAKHLKADPDNPTKPEQPPVDQVKQSDLAPLPPLPKPKEQ
ncbi:Uncharacterised protein [Mycobacteroides abscessus subsp. bolletii]|uniref:hypothetical protein n=1 Tax=Mycobacteroides abscessus TaxID=36809 RepID=UPI0009D0AE2B|nr:hypothetical protein [Mycobacteroides abscessus]SLI26728.1 Uncharacterised protein [Mycobacteroides abscessus subsp. bolletii]